MFQLSIKVCICYLQREKLTKLLQKMEVYFWETENADIQKTAQFVFIYIWLGCFLCFGFAVKPFFNNGKQTPLMCWTPKENSSPYEIICVIQVYILFSVVSGVVGFDLFYMYINFNICVQFKLLSYELNNLVQNSERETMFQLKKCSQHHQFLLEYFILFSQ